MAKKVDMSTIRLEVQTVTTAPEFRVSEEGRIVGDLRVSRGGAFWRPKNFTQYYHLSWEQIDELFQAKGVQRAVGEYKIAPPTAGAFDEF